MRDIEDMKLVCAWYLFELVGTEVQFVTKYYTCEEGIVELKKLQSYNRNKKIYFLQRVDEAE